MSKRALITGLVILLLVVVFTQAITVWLGSGSAITVHLAALSASGNDLASFSLDKVYLTGGCSIGSAGGCPDPK